MKKVLLAITLLGLSVASAKSYNVTLGPGALAGNTLKGGEYTLELKGDRVVIKNNKTTAEVPVKVEQSDRKNDATAVSYKQVDGMNRIEEIRLGGTKLRLVFESPVKAD